MFDESANHESMRFAECAFTVGNEIFKRIVDRHLSSLLILLVRHFSKLGGKVDELKMRRGMNSGDEGDIRE